METNTNGTERKNAAGAGAESPGIVPESLADRVERAEGPSRELDILVAVAVDWRWTDWEEGDPTVRGHVEKHGLEWMVARCRQSVTVWPRLLPAYTASLDAAMSLVPEGWTALEWLAPIDDAVVWTAYFTLADGSQVAGFHEDRVMALCAAALRARDGNPEGENGEAG